MCLAALPQPAPLSTQCAVPQVDVGDFVRLRMQRPSVRALTSNVAIDSNVAQVLVKTEDGRLRFQLVQTGAKMWRQFDEIEAMPALATVQDKATLAQ